MQAGADGLGVLAVFGEGDDAAFLRALIVQGDAGDGAQREPQGGGEERDAQFDILQPDFAGVADGLHQADAASDKAFPILKPFGGGVESIGVGAGPCGGMQINERRVDVGEEAFADVQKPGATRTAQEFAPRSGQDITANRAYIQGHLPDGLAGIQQVDEAMFAGDAADLHRRVHKAALGGDVGQGNQSGAGGYEGFEGGNVDLAGGIGWHKVDMQAAAFGLLQKGKIV